MQPTPPPPPAAPTPVLAGQPAVAGIEIPGSPQALRGLRERREIQRDQLARANNRREELVQQLNRTGAPEAREGIVERIKLLDERILQLERQQMVTEQSIAGAPSEVLAGTSSDGGNGGVDEDAAAGIGFGAFFFGIVLTLAIGRLRRRFKARRDRTLGVTSASVRMSLPADDPRLEQLSHAVGAMAEEIERIGEGQRFLTQILAGQQREQSVLGAERR